MFHSWKPLGWLAGMWLTGVLGVVHAAGPVVTSRAYLGEPFGVGEVTIQYPDDAPPEWHTDQLPRIVAAEAERVHYPAWKVVYSTRGAAQLKTLRMMFLLQGKKERRIQVHAVEPIAATVTPLENSAAHGRLLGEWWDAYNAAPDPRLNSGQSAQLQNYLRTMLARRIGLRPPGTVQLQSRLEQFQLPKFINDGLSLLIGSTSIRAAMQNERMLATASPQEPSNRPLPRATAPPAVPLPEKLQPETAVEAIALHVPAECFYARCQRFADYLWLRDFVDAWGGSVDNIVAQESFDYSLRSSVERRLALAPNAETRDLLDESISDLAIIGTDLFFRDGPSVGVLLEAKDDRNLAEVIRRQRDAVRSEPGAWEREVRLGDHTARLLTTSDGEVRSIYAISGKYHLITTSSFIARKFLACERGEGSLGKLDEFRYARQKMPLSRNDQVFLYLSDPFFRLLVGPAYRVEMTRRAAAIADLQLVELARLAAASEGLGLPTVAMLRDGGFLPKRFGPRADGTAAEIVNDRARDSLRGTAGKMLPIPDVEIDGVTPSEAQSYREFAVEYQQQWQSMDPVTVAIARKPAGRMDRETVALDFIITPYVHRHYLWMAQYLMYLNLGPSPQRLSVEEDLLAVLEGNWRWPNDGGNQQSDLGGTLFAGFKDLAPPFRVERGQLVVEDPFKPHTTGQYRTDSLGELLFLGSAAETDPEPELFWGPLSHLGRDVVEHFKRNADLDGYVEVSDPAPNGHPFYPFRWGRVQKGMVTFGTSREDLEKITPGLKLVAADRPALMRLRTKDLQGTRLGRIIDASGYLSARQLSALNTHLLWQFDQQLHQPAEKIGASVASVVGGRPRCPLGGEYTLGDGKGAPAVWSSSAWKSNSLEKVDRVPEDYRFPFTAWVRELGIDFLVDATTISTHVEITWQR